MEISKTAVNTTLISVALEAAHNYLRQESATQDRGKLTWHEEEGGNEWQQNLLRFHERTLPYLNNLIGHQAFAHIDPAEVNKFFAKFRNIPLRFEENGIDPNLFYVGTYFGLKDLSWRGGNADEYYYDTSFKPYQINNKSAYRLSETVHKVRFYDMGQGENMPLIVIPTSNERIKLLVYIETFFDELDLFERAQVFRKFIGTHQIAKYSGVVMPNVVFEEEIKLGEGKLKNLWTTSYEGEKVRVADAGMFLRLILCPQGPLAEGAAKVIMEKEAHMPDTDKPRNFVLDRPFAFSFVDTNMPTVPYVTGWVSPAAFSEKKISIDNYR